MTARMVVHTGNKHGEGTMADRSTAVYEAVTVGAEPVVNLGVVSGVATIDLTMGTCFYANCAGPVTWNITGYSLSDNGIKTFALVIKNGGVGAQTFTNCEPMGGGPVPEFRNNVNDYLVFTGLGIGTMWQYGRCTST